MCGGRVGGGGAGPAAVRAGALPDIRTLVCCLLLTGGGQILLLLQA